MAKNNFCNSLNFKFNFKLYFSLLIFGLCPTIYTTFRVFLLGQLPGEYAYSIAGQLSWVNLLYEILNEAIILPLFFFVGQVKDDKYEFRNRVKGGLLVSFVLYALFSAIISMSANQLLDFMATSSDIIEQSAEYIRIESVAHIFSLLCQFTFIALVTIVETKSVYILTISRLLFSVLTDIFLVSTLPVSLNLGVNGIGYSNIIVNLLLFAISVYILYKNDCNIFSHEKITFSWMKNFVKIGSISGVESFVRNIVYMLMIARMVNAVAEQGTYWVANSFIWGWLLLPITQLAEVVKKDIAANKDNIKNMSSYFIITTAICILWFISMPLWKPFMSNVLCIQDSDKVLNLVILLVGFYVFYAFQNVFDSAFYGAGKTQYMLAESIGTNLFYYGVVFVLYKLNVWTPTLTNIALMFGFGIVFDSFVSFIAYVVFYNRYRKELHNCQCDVDIEPESND